MPTEAGAKVGLPAGNALGRFNDSADGGVNSCALIVWGVAWGLESGGDSGKGADGGNSGVGSVTEGRGT